MPETVKVGISMGTVKAGKVGKSGNCGSKRKQGKSESWVIVKAGESRGIVEVGKP